MKKVLLLALLLANSNLVINAENSYVKQAKQYAQQAGCHIKNAANKSADAFEFIISKSDKMMTKKTAIALLLAMGPGFYLSSKIFSLGLMQGLLRNISKIAVKGGILAGEPVVSGATQGVVEAIKENPKFLSNITTALAQVTATTTVQATKAAMWAGLQTIWDDKLQFLTLLAIYGTGLAAAGTAGTIGAATIASTAKGVGPQIAVKVIIPAIAKIFPFITIPALAKLKI